MTTQLFQVDAFAERPFAGNPAAVCILSEGASGASAGWMQRVAAEMNLSETAFVSQRENGFSLRWFTPKAEVALCGHATLATSHILWETGILRPDQVAVYETLSGTLTARSLRRNNDTWIELDFPATPPQATDAPEGLLSALGVNATYVGKSRFDYLVAVDSQDTVRMLTPDFGALLALGVRGVMVTAPATGRFDFVSRFFAPAVGINEDPVTGSAHCTLTPYWAERLGKLSMRAFQASQRGGILEVELIEDRVRIRGRAVTVLRGELLAEDPHKP
ncbi:PhzF family phenazine biosynthesis protein [Candidatus Bipolaricaulota bacterium]|nr:PhzF family phenazine biosynthesis protein [Candidatus Bipolaricaulota bacterium]